MEKKKKERIKKERKSITIINNRTDQKKTDINLFSTITKR